jgi:hypothetical protein
MMFVAEGNRLHMGNSGSRDIRGVVDDPCHPRQGSENENTAKYANLGKGIRAAMENL